MRMAGIIFGLGLLCAVMARAAAPEANIRRLDGKKLSAREIDAEVQKQMEQERVAGLALALIEDGRPIYVKSYGFRSVEEARPLEADTIMYAASLTKLTFTYMVMQLVDEKKVDLDKPIATYLAKPLPEYPKYAELSDDARWKSVTPRMLLNHTAGFPNFRFLNPDEKLDFKFDPGSRHAYSGEGFNLLQFVLEEGLGLDVGQEMQRRVFERFGMTRTSMTWRDDFEANVAHGYALDGKLEKHRARRNVRAAGSMDSTIADYANFLASFMRGEGLSAEARREMLRPQIAITSAHQFPTLDNGTNPANEKIGLAAGLGAVLFKARMARRSSKAAMMIGPATWRSASNPKNSAFYSCRTASAPRSSTPIWSSRSSAKRNSRGRGNTIRPSRHRRRPRVRLRGVNAPLWGSRCKTRPAREVDLPVAASLWDAREFESSPPVAHRATATEKPAHEGKP